MLKWLVWFPLKLLGWALGLAGAVGLLLTAMIATPFVRPPELKSISAARGTVDMRTLPAIERYQGRDGTALGFRHYPAAGPGTGRGAIVIHGSSGSSGGPIHALASALAVHGVETWAVDIRGHGVSGTRGDIAYVGQLEDDLADFVAEVRKIRPDLPLTLIGHSAGGGFALRIAGSHIQNLFTRTVLLAPYLGPRAPTNRPNSGGWANADIPRILALMVLHRLGIDCCDALPTLAFAVPPDSASRLVPLYSERLRSNFGVHLDYRADLAAATRPITIFSGADDELMLADKYVDAVRGFANPVSVRLIAGVNHMGIVSAPNAVSAIAEDVAKSAPGA
ncbi:alpha/beta hydrolase [Bradyrhizobium sp.]|uniref:alpha/beta hydrolase n=1 Tax=Bradyrhizobium sp. TaxID=376 RepID=UPI003C4B89D7